MKSTAHRPPASAARMLSRSHPRKREFAALADHTGWTQAELARKLEITRGGINGLVKGPTVPSPALLKLLRMIVAAEKPDSMPPPEPVPEPELAEKRRLKRLTEILGELDGHDQAELLLSFISIVRAFSRRRASSAADAAALRELRRSAATTATAVGRSQAALRQLHAASATGSTTAGASGKRRAAPPARAARVSAPAPGLK